MWESYLGTADHIAFFAPIQDFNKIYIATSGSRTPAPVFEYISKNSFFAAAP
jgi:hypothetical protein